MKREFMGAQISQRTSDRFFNGTELLALYNKHNNTQKRFKDFWENQNTQEFLRELENDLVSNGDNSAHLKTHETTRGNGGATWLQPYLFVKFSMWLSPKFELQIIKWVYDNLIDFRVDAGDYYKDMCQALKEFHERNPDEPFSPDAYSKEATKLNLIVFGSPKPKQRNEATEYELALMNDLQLYNIYLMQQNCRARTRYIFQERAKEFNFMNSKKLLK